MTPFPSSNPTQIAFQGDEMGSLYDKMTTELDLCFQNALATPGVIATANPQIAGMHSLRDALLIAKRSRDPTSALALLQKVT